MYYKTEAISYNSYEDFDDQLSKLEDKGWLPNLLLDNIYDDKGGVAVITFKINDK